MDFNNYQRRPSVIGYFLVAVMAFSLGYFSIELGIKDAEVIDSNENVITSEFDLELFWTVMKTLEAKYFDSEEVDKEALLYGAIAGAVESLDDPYTVYMTPDETNEFLHSLNGELEGIGAELTVEDNLITVITPIKGSPAEKAGVLPGDVIYRIEDEETFDMTLMDAVMKIRGEKGTTVTLTLIREGVDEPIEVSIVRDEIKIDSVHFELNDGIAYLEVSQFNDKTNEQFGQAMSEMLVNKPEGIIVDLRFNGGGFLDIAVELLSYLLPKDTDAVIIKQKDMPDRVMQTNGNPKILDVPVVVLVNGASASASEIFAGAIQDHGRGVVMGTQTFGKGSVQEVDDFYDGSSLRVTIAKWFTPSDRGINKIGLVPDIVVEISEDDVNAEFDRQRDEAEKYLKGL